MDSQSISTGVPLGHRTPLQGENSKGVPKAMRGLNMHALCDEGSTPTLEMIDFLSMF